MSRVPTRRGNIRKTFGRHQKEDSFISISQQSSYYIVKIADKLCFYLYITFSLHRMNILSGWQQGTKEKRIKNQLTVVQLLTRIKVQFQRDPSVIRLFMARDFTRANSSQPQTTTEFSRQSHQIIHYFPIPRSS